MIEGFCAFVYLFTHAMDCILILFYVPVVVYPCVHCIVHFYVSEGFFMFLLAYLNSLYCDGHECDRQPLSSVLLLSASYRRSQEFVLGRADNRGAEMETLKAPRGRYALRSSPTSTVKHSTSKRVLRYLELEKTHLIATNLSYLTFLRHIFSHNSHSQLLNVRLSYNICPFCTTNNSCTNFFPLRLAFGA